MKKYILKESKLLRDSFIYIKFIIIKKIKNKNTITQIFLAQYFE